MYNDSVTTGRWAAPRSLATTAPRVRARPYSRPNALLANDVMPVDDEFLFDRDFAFASYTEMHDAQIETVGGSSGSSVVLSTPRPLLDESLFLDGLLASENDASSQHHCVADLSAALYQKNQHSGSWCSWMRPGFSLAIVTDNPIMRSDSNVLAILQVARPRAQYHADLVIQSLRSFPTMMLRRETFPWFIHPHSQLLSEPTSDALPEALSACMGVAQVFVSRTLETKSFVWRTIRAEHCRFRQEVCLLLAP